MLCDDIIDACQLRLEQNKSPDKILLLSPISSVAVCSLSMSNMLS